MKTNKPTIVENNLPSVANDNLPTIVKTKATNKFLRLVRKYQPLSASCFDLVKPLGLHSTQGFQSLYKRLEEVGLITIARKAPLPNTYSLTKDRELLMHYSYLFESTRNLTLEDD